MRPTHGGGVVGGDFGHVELGQVGDERVFVVVGPDANFENFHIKR